MNTNQRTAGLLALAGAAAYLVLVPVHLTHGTFDGSLETTADYVNDIAFLSALLLTVPALLVLGAARGLPRRATVAIAVGQGLVAVGVAAGLMAGESPSWFAAVGLPGNLIAFAAWIVVARRATEYPMPVRILMAVSVPFGLLGGEIGLTIVPAALWLFLGTDLTRAERPSQRAIGGLQGRSA